MDWSSIAEGSAGGAASGLVSGAFGLGSQLMGQAFTKEAMKEGIRWRVMDLKKAGLNPILASGMNVSAPAPSSVKGPDFDFSGSSAKAQQRRVGEQDLLNAKQLGRKFTAEADIADARAQYFRNPANQPQIDAATHGTLIGEEFGNTAFGRAIRLLQSGTAQEAWELFKSFYNEGRKPNNQSGNEVPLEWKTVPGTGIQEKR